jgi:hypothetical protein
MSYTKGPWRVGKVQSVVGIVVWRGDLPANTNHKRICRNVSNEDDARLIAAAPDLLEACERMLNSTDYCDDMRPLMDAVRIAVQKARNPQ